MLDFMCTVSLLQKRFSACFGPRDPVYVFHHIPKCGGSSVRTALVGWFIRRKDYRRGWSDDYPPAYDLSRFRSIHCLCGHFEVEGHFLHQRYPEVIQNKRFRIFSFVRNPLSLQLSLHRFLKKEGQPVESTIEAQLQTRPNFMAHLFAVDESNFKEVLDRYSFIGLIEEGQPSWICSLL